MKHMKILATILLTFSLLQAEETINNEAEIYDTEAHTTADEQNNEKTENDTADQKREREWLADSKTIFAIIAPLRKYKTDPNDSSIQEESRNLQLVAAIQKLNARMKGKNLRLHGAMVEEVKAERSITKYGIKKLKSIKRELERDPSTKAMIKSLGKDWASNPFMALTLGFYLGGCERCFSNTGKYLVTYKIFKENSDDGQSGIAIFEPEPDEAPGSEDMQSDRLIRVEIKMILSNKANALALKKGSIVPVSGKIMAIEYETTEFSEKVKLYLK